MPLPRGKLRFGRDGLYAVGGACGFTPAEVDAMSLWQFRAVAGGVAQANGVEQEGLSTDDVDRLGDLIESYPTVH